MQSSNQLIKTFRLLKQNLWIILFSTIIFAIGGYLFNVNFVTPTYKGTTQLVAKTNMLSESDDTLNAANYKLLMINTYKSLATSYSILADVQKKIKETQNIDLSVDQISQMVTVSQEDNSQIFSISVVSEAPRISQIISGNIAESLSSKVGKLLGEENSISIISPARASSIPISPNIKLNTVMFAMIGWLLSVTAIFIWALTNQFVEKEDNFEEELGLINLGTVVEMKANQSRKNKLYVIDEGR
ncbi:chain length determinant protein [Enterococcus faecalis 13-SD-W-01]|nr:chain length determinant protein [Enterococcus faecalis 13-SD-W-01]